MPRTIPRTSGMSGAQAPLDAHAVENPARYFFDRDFGGIEHRDAVPLEQRFRRSDFESHLRSGCIALSGRRSFRICCSRSGLIVKANSFREYASSAGGSFRDSRSSSVSGKFAANIPYCIARYRQVGVFPSAIRPPGSRPRARNRAPPSRHRWPGRNSCVDARGVRMRVRHAMCPTCNMGGLRLEFVLERC